MIFTKQDQIQHGETQRFQSPPTLVSPPFTSPTTSLVEIGKVAKMFVPEPSLVDSSVYDASDYDSLFDLDWLTQIDSETKHCDTW